MAYYNNGAGPTTTGSGAVSVPGTVDVAGTVDVNSGTVTLSGTTNVAGTVGVSGGTVEIGNNVPVTPTVPTRVATDCSITLATAGTAYSVIASGTHWTALCLHNPSASNIGFSLTSATPAIGAAGTYTLAPGGTWNSPPGFTQSGAVHATGAAASLVLTGTYWP
jgi:hypothetical protein